MSRTVKLEMDSYMVQTRTQAKSSSVSVPEVHDANKGLIPHVKTEKSAIVTGACPIPPAHHLRPVYHNASTDQRLPTKAVPPYPNLELDKAELESEESKGNSTHTQT